MFFAWEFGLGESSVGIAFFCTALHAQQGIVLQVPWPQSEQAALRLTSWSLDSTAAGGMIHTPSTHIPRTSTKYGPVMRSMV